MGLQYQMYTKRETDNVDSDIGLQYQMYAKRETDNVDSDIGLQYQIKNFTDHTVGTNNDQTPDNDNDINFKWHMSLGGRVQSNGFQATCVHDNSADAAPAHCDGHFGPLAYDCSGRFDFTLAFEQSVLSIGPSAVLLLAAPLRIHQLRSQSRKVAPGASHRLHVQKTIASNIKRALLPLSTSSG
ncbi:hypothetical protein INS49_004819 [Diaporthe citri]|uniref:uncharacterized protein n=1 Tax=Diaporthe citri TaxID=83186 RepID=UPI001C820834|nr:uncharacterized protein INS49_004819 [Diaporthe citri]KAG6354215.1 hypothetical protein INS49_004819 [Diaporthe citri]